MNKAFSLKRAVFLFLFQFRGGEIIIIISQWLSSPCRAYASSYEVP
jgi:hypothetical protein